MVESLRVCSLLEFLPSQPQAYSRDALEMISSAVIPSVEELKCMMHDPKP